jgi:hypothetical protein
MRDRSDRYHVESVSTLAPSKKIGGYLVDAGLLTADQINVALNDQQATGMRFGEIIVARGWLKEQTVEWIMAKVVEPERQALKQRAKRQEQVTNRWSHDQASQASPQVNSATGSQGTPTKPGIKVASVAEKPSPPKTFVRREAPISKPLPSVGSSDGDVNWVG